MVAVTEAEGDDIAFSFYGFYGGLFAVIYSSSSSIRFHFRLEKKRGSPVTTNDIKQIKYKDSVSSKDVPPFFDDVSEDSLTFW